MTIRLGDRVYLRACRAAMPGVVIRAERGKLVVYWRDLDFWSRHAPEALELAADEMRADAGEANKNQGKP